MTNLELLMLEHAVTAGTYTSAEMRTNAERTVVVELHNKDNRDARSLVFTAGTKSEQRRIVYKEYKRVNGVEEVTTQFTINLNTPTEFVQALDKMNALLNKFFIAATSLRTLVPTMTHSATALTTLSTNWGEEPVPPPAPAQYPTKPTRSYGTEPNLHNDKDNIHD